MAQLEKSEQARVLTADDSTELLWATMLDPRFVRLEKSAILAGERFHDVIEIEQQADGSLKLLRVAARSGLEKMSWVVAASVLELPGVAALLQKVDECAGQWEATAGILTVHVPPLDFPSMKIGFDGLWRRPNDRGVSFESEGGSV